MVLAKTSRPENKAVLEESNSAQAAWRTGPVFVIPGRKTDGVHLSTSEALKDYACFVMDQEAQYCQQ